LYLASLKTGSNLKLVLAINTLILGAGLVLFSHQHIYLIALLFAMITGFGMMSQNAISNTLIQTIVEPSMRGRVISLYVTVFFGMQPLGGLLVGSVSKLIGTPDTILLEGIAGVIIGLIHYRYLRKEKLKSRQNVIAHEEAEVQAQKT
jgi:MFS family permease